MQHLYRSTDGYGETTVIDVPDGYKAPILLDLELQPRMGSGCTTFAYVGPVAGPREATARSVADVRQHMVAAWLVGPKEGEERLKSVQVVRVDDLDAAIGGQD